MKICLNDAVFNILARVADTEKVEAYVIGGWVRDCILGREHADKDIDTVVVGSGISLAKKAAKSFGKGIKVTQFRNFGTAMFRSGDYEIEFVGARKESYSRGSRKPVVENGTLEDDQKRRDFTINALALGLNNKNFGKLLDPFGGLQDIKDKIIRTPLDPEIGRAHV